MLESKKQKKLRLEFENYLNQIFSNAAREFNIRPANNSFVNSASIKQFELFKELQNPKLLGCWQVSDPKSQVHMACVSIDSTLLLRGRPTYKETQTHLFLYGFLKTKSDFGISLIQREGIMAKIMDLFIKADIDFENHPEFSSKYQCFSKDETNFRAAMTPEILDFLSTVDHLEMEFQNNTCLFRTEKSIIDQKNNLELFHIGLVLSQLLSK